MDKKIALCFTLLFFAAINVAHADTLTVPMAFTVKEGNGPSIGTVTFKDTAFGLLITPNLSGLAPGMHGFHIHVNPSCADLGMAAGGHYDPQNTEKHLGPYNFNGHAGDLPALYVDKNGMANSVVLAPRLKTTELVGHSVMIHEHGDNYSDQPEKLGGGAARMACGVIKKN